MVSPMSVEYCGMTMQRADASIRSQKSLRVTLSDGLHADNNQKSRQAPPVRSENSTVGEMSEVSKRSLQNTTFKPYITYTVVAAIMPSQIFFV